MRPARTPAVLLVAVAVATIACAQAPGAVGPSPDPTPPVGATPPAPEEPGGGGGNSGNRGEPGGPIGAQPPPVEPGPEDGALQVDPEPGIVDARPHAWDRITIAPDGRTLTVYYWGGVEDCYGLAGVDLQADGEGRLVVRVMEGRRGNLAPDTACIEIALLKAATVELEEPLVAPAE